MARLDELNHKAGDPSLWNNPEQAQMLMRERQRLEVSVSGIRKLAQDMSTTRSV